MVGITWLLNVMGVLPGVDWFWTGCPAAVGIPTLGTGGINKVTVCDGGPLWAGHRLLLFSLAVNLLYRRQIDSRIAPIIM